MALAGKISPSGYELKVNHEYYPSKQVEHHSVDSGAWAGHEAAQDGQHVYNLGDASAHDDGSYKGEGYNGDSHAYEGFGAVEVSHGYESGHDDGSYAGHDDGSYAGHDDHKDYHAHPQYKFEYGVKDGHTGDHKSQWETRDGDVVKGEYTLDEADGTKRVVEYSSDKKNGFNAVVKKIGHAHHPQVYGHKEQHSY